MQRFLLSVEIGVRDHFLKVADRFEGWAAGPTDTYHQSAGYKIIHHGYIHQEEWQDGRADSTDIIKSLTVW